MIKKRGVVNKIARTNVFVIFLFTIFLFGSAFALYAFPAATGVDSRLVSQVCNTEIASAAEEAFGGVCSATTNIDTNNAVTQTATVSANNQYMGIRTSNYNSSITNCGGVTNVKICYEWWSSSASIRTCTVKVDANGGGSYSTASSTCPGTTANPGEICTDVTALETWTCDNFFTASGTRALAYLQVRATTGGAKTLTTDDLYFNVTYSSDVVAPTVSIAYPTNTIYTSNVTTLNFTATDTNLAVCKYSIDGGANTTTSCSSGVQVNVTGLNIGSGSHTIQVYANDTYNYNGTASITFSINLPPIISNITIVPDPSGVGASLNITGNGVNDSELGTLQFYCADTSSPTNNNICSTGNLSNLASPYKPYCTYTPNKVAGNYTVFCRMYDGVSYSSEVNKTYQVLGNTLSTYIISVAGDTTPGYFDTTNDNIANILVNGSSGMSCKWFTTDTVYSGSGTACNVTGTVANCSISTTTQGTYTRYVSCQDTYGNSQTSSDNLDVTFYLDYTAPNTTDNADNVSIHVPTYEVTITESDNVDTDPTSYYCYSTSVGCTPTTSIDNGGIISFSSSNRGPIYLRYYSVDDALNSQTIVNRTININRLPIFSSATDNAATILGGTTVTISTISSDLDSGQNINLYVCNSTGATSSGCTGGQYCSATGTANLSCGFASESDTAVHTWYSYIFDAGGEATTANPLTGFYSTDSTGPSIIIISPLNQSYPSVNVTAEISNSETSPWAAYSLDGAANISMTNISLVAFTSSLNNLAYGLHNITFYTNDTLGNVGFTSTIYFSIATPTDVTPPTITIVSLTNTSYTSTSPLLNITTDEDLSWAGYKLNGSTLTNLSNATSSNGYTTLDLSQESTNTVIVYANDTSNNQATKTIIIYADTLAPRYSSVSAPSTNQSQSVNCSIVWNDTYSLNNVLIGENSSGSYENHTISFSGSSGTASYLIVGNKLSNAGTYSCIFYATDSAGNTNSTSNTFTVTDVTSPTLTITSPSNGATYNQLSISLSLVTSENASSAWYYLNSTGVNATLGNTTKTNWNATLSGLSTANSYTIIFWANDSSGNIGTSGAKTFAVDTGATDLVAPVISITSITNASYKSLTGTFLNITTNENVSWVKYSLNGSANVSLTNTSMYNWNVTLVDLAQVSTNSLIVYANDTSGNIGISSVIFYADSLAPQFTLTTATPNPANETQNVLCSTYATESFNFSSVIISENATSSGNFLNHTIDLFSTGYANYTMLNVARGTYTCIFYATDSAGNSNLTQTTFTVNDVTAPTLTINSPVAQNYSTSSVLFSLTTNENVSSAKYSLDGGTTNISLLGSGVSWSKTSTVADGSYTVTFYANDSSGNNGTASVSIVVDTSVNDLVAPTLTIWSPIANSYDLDGSVLLNITSDESLSWAGYRNNSGTLTDLGNVSLTNWNKTINLPEGTHTITLYANDTRSNPKNQGSRSILFYVDLNAPTIDSFVCDSSIEDSANLTCNASLSDAVGLSHAILSYNFSGNFANSSNISLSSYNDTIEHLFTQANYTPGNYNIKLYLFDLAGRMTLSSPLPIAMLDDVAPIINNLSYFPNSLDSLDPGVDVTVNASITEDYSISSVKVYYKNISDSSWSSEDMTNTTVLDYNATINLGAGNWTIYVNATDSQGNTNSSQSYNLSVYPDISQIITTNITSIKSFTYAQRNSANELGYVILNATSDSALNYQVTISADSSILSRFNLNNTLGQTENYSAASSVVLNIPLYVNLSDLTIGLYPFNITVVSGAGTQLFERNLNIQTSDGPYFSMAFEDYSSSVTRGQSEVSYSVSVTNLGTQDAQGVFIEFSLPTGFDLSSGNLLRYLGNLPVGVSATNSIKINVSSSLTDNSLTINANVNSTNTNSSNISKIIIITDPLIVTQTIVTQGSSGGGGGGGQALSVAYTKSVSLVRGVENSFDISVVGKYPNKTLENLKLELTGFPSQYFSITPSVIDSISYGETKNFKVTLKAPSYKSYEEYSLKAVINGLLVQGTTETVYSETQNIRLVIQEISKEKTLSSLNEAKQAISLMSSLGFNVDKLNELLSFGTTKIADGKNKEAYDLASQIIATKELALSVDEKIKKLKASLVDPSESGSLGALTGRAVFASSAIQDLLDMAVSAFERGDYALAQERALSVENLLALERKGNVILFIYLYWPYILALLVILTATTIFVYRFYQKRSVGEKIEDADKKEARIKQLVSTTQEKYFTGKIGVGPYHSIMKLYTDNLAKLREERLKLRSKRVKILSKEQVSKELDRERGQTEKEIVHIQEDFYKDKKIGEAGYKTQFGILNERLAEIEDERLTTNLLNKHNVKENKSQAIVKSSESSFLGIPNYFKIRQLKKEKELKDKINKMLKEKEAKK